MRYAGRMTDPEPDSNSTYSTSLIWCPFPDRGTARAVAGILLEEDLIGCANIIGGVESIFKWQDEVETSTEVAVLLKTRSGLLNRAIDRLGVLHPYDSPAILGWNCDAAHETTETWLAALKPR